MSLLPSGRFLCHAIVSCRAWTCLDPRLANFARDDIWDVRLSAAARHSQTGLLKSESSSVPVRRAIVVFVMHVVALAAARLALLPALRKGRFARHAAD